MTNDQSLANPEHCALSTEHFVVDALLAGRLQGCNRFHREGRALMERLSALIGFVVILGIAFALSNNKHAIRWRTVGWGLLLQILIAIAVLKGEVIANALTS